LPEAEFPRRTMSVLLYAELHPMHEENIACSLRVREIYLFEQLADVVGLPHATRLVLAGDWPAVLAYGALLVARRCPGASPLTC
jgi:hypothetical protein